MLMVGVGSKPGDGNTGRYSWQEPVARLHLEAVQASGVKAGRSQACGWPGLEQWDLPPCTALLHSQSLAGSTVYE